MNRPHIHSASPDLLLQQAVEHAQAIERAMQYHNSGQLSQAETIYQQILQADPNQPDALHLLGVINFQVGKSDAAIDLIEKAIAFMPGNADAHYNLGNALTLHGKLDEAVKCYQIALSIKPNYAEAHNNLGNAYRGLGELGEAIRSYQTAISIKPDYAAAFNNLGQMQLLKENFRDGWKNFNWRSQVKSSGSGYKVAKKQHMLIPETHVPIWEGQPLDGKTVHVHAEQGIGEQIMFSTMLPDLVSSGAKVIFECDKRLVPLYYRSFPNIHVVPITTPPDPLILSNDVDYRINSGSLGMHFRRSASDFTPREQFLKADQLLTDKYRKTYRELGSGHKIGISWKSDSPHRNIKKNTPLELWKPILETPNCQFISLQYGDVESDIEKVKRELGIDIYIDPEVSPLNSLEQCAAQISAVDLVISISNATVHMAAACGINTWMLLSEPPLWHWFLKRENSLWYKHVRKFRPVIDQPTKSTVDMIAEALPESLANSRNF